MKKTFFWGFLFVVIGIFCIGCESHKQPTDSLAHNGAEAESEDSGTIDGIEWELKGGVLTIRGEGALRETPWSENVDCIQKVVIEDGVTQLPYLGFANYENLNEVIIGNGITDIGPDTFLGCENLETVSLGENLEIIDGGAFSGCGFKEFTVPEGVYLINGDSFSECKNLEKITIPETVTQIGEDAFKGCDNVVVYTVKGSAAEEYAIGHGISVVAAERGK